MQPANALRSVVVLGAFALLAACSTPEAPELPVAQPVGTEAEYCPPIALREGTAILRRGEGPEQQFVVSIGETSRSCRVVNGQLLIEVGVAGRLVPGVAARQGGVQLPIRVVVTRGDDVLYSNLGRVAVGTTPGAGAQPFLYVDRGIRIAEPASRQVSIQVGFDEQN